MKNSNTLSYNNLSNILTAIGSNNIGRRCLGYLAPEKQRIKLDIFLNFFIKKHLLHFKTTFFLFQFAVLKECNSFDSNSLSFIPSCSLLPTNNCFCATESDIDLQTILHPSMNYWFQYCDLH